MQNRVPTPREDRPALPDFTPVPRKHRHDGWTPERQKAFIEALADTGAVSRAARMVNMAQANCYTLRRAPGAEGFRRAWDAALDFGVQRLKDIAFERAIEGYLVPVFVAGKLAGYRRKTNDALLMFCLRHYGQDAQGRRTKVEYFSTRAEAGAAGGAGAVAPASTTTVRTVISGNANGAGGAEQDDSVARELADFAGVALDREAEATIAAALAACAARRREADAVIDRGGMHGAAAQLDDRAAPFVRCDAADEPTWLTQEPVMAVEDFAPFADGEDPWEYIGLDKAEWDLRADLRAIALDLDETSGVTIAPDGDDATARAELRALALSLEEEERQSVAMARAAAAATPAPKRRAAAGRRAAAHAASLTR